MSELVSWPEEQKCRRRTPAGGYLPPHLAPEPNPNPAAYQAEQRALGGTPALRDGTLTTDCLLLTTDHLLLTTDNLLLTTTN